MRQAPQNQCVCSGSQNVWPCNHGTQIRSYSSRCAGKPAGCLRGPIPRHSNPHLGKELAVPRPVVPPCQVLDSLR